LKKSILIIWPGKKEYRVANKGHRYASKRKKIPPAPRERPSRTKTRTASRMKEGKNRKISPSTPAKKRRGETIKTKEEIQNHPCSQRTGIWTRKGGHSLQRGEENGKRVRPKKKKACPSGKDRQKVFTLAKILL